MTGNPFCCLNDIESDKLPSLESEIAKVWEEFEEKITQREIHMRKQNLLFNGVPKFTAHEDVFETTIATIAKILGITTDEAKKIQLINAHRLPRNTAAATRPATNNITVAIIVRIRMSDRDNVLRAF